MAALRVPAAQGLVHRGCEYARLPAAWAPAGRGMVENKMKLRTLAILLAAPLCACASQPSGSDANAPGPVKTGVAYAVTPIMIGFKIPQCGLAAPIMAPAALISAVIPFKNGPSGWEYLKDGVVEGCGQPYVANPKTIPY